MRLSMVLIARNERENVRPCFEPFWDQCDEVVLVDTGSRDGTITEARRFASERGEPAKLVVGRFKWCDDFAAARTYAHSLATGDVHLSIDLDWRLEGANWLRREASWLLRSKSTVTVARLFDQHSGEQLFPLLMQPPVVWENRIWEIVTFEGRARFTRRIIAKHTRQHGRSTRDLRIAMAWIEEEPRSEVAHIAALAEAAMLERWRLVVRLGKAASSVEMSERGRARILAEVGRARVHLDDMEGAERAYRDSVALDPIAARPQLQLGSLLLRRHNLTEAEEWLRRAAALAHTDEIREMAIAALLWIEQRRHSSYPVRAALVGPAAFIWV